MTFWRQNYMQHLRLDFKAGSAQNCILRPHGQLKHQLCARSFWNIQVTAPCDRRVLSPGHGRCPLTGNGLSPCTKGLGVPLHLLLGSSWETKPWERPWRPTAAGCKQKEGQQDQGHPPAAQGQHEPPGLGWLSYTLAFLRWGVFEMIPGDTPHCRLWRWPSERKHFLLSWPIIH